MDAVSLTEVTQRFGDVTALDHVSVSFGERRITGLVGRNGAGKSTLLELVSGRARARLGSVTVHGKNPYEDRAVLSQVCAVTESQPYPKSFRVSTVLTCAGLLHPQWDISTAHDLVDLFDLRRQQKVTQLSRGQRSALGVVVALASRAPVTVLDEPYVGLDAVTRRQFYVRLLEEFVAHPRTVILSSHLIDEVAHLLDHVVVIAHGRVVLDAATESVRDGILELTGPSVLLDEYAARLTVLSRADLGGLTRAIVRGARADEAAARGLRVAHLPFQEAVLALSSGPSRAPGSAQRTAPDHHTMGVRR